MSMFLKNLYIELGRLFYYLAAVDGNVADNEKDSLLRYIQTSWKHFDDSTDRFGTDNAYLIDFSFEYEEEAGKTDNYLEAFKSFYHQNKAEFSPIIQQKILYTAKAIAESYRGENQKEKEIIDQLQELFKN